MIASELQQIVDQIIGTRHSVRAFLSRALAKEDIQAILALAAWA
jgi:nitroreductase